MHRPQRHGVASAPLTWPRKSEWHAGILDFGLLGGASFDTDKQSWSFARNMEEFVYCRTSPLIQMLPRVRPWEPRLIEPWPQDFPHVLKKGFETSINSSINNSIQYLEAVFAEDGATNDVPLLYNIISESGYQDYSLSYYDPFMGNVCAAGQFVGLPIVATPGGPTGADLAISLVSSRAHQRPPFGLLAPRSVLLSFLSPICQIATPPSARSHSREDDGRILVRTRETVTVVAPSTMIPSVVSRVEHDYVSVIAEIPTTPSSCTDVTIHAAISPYMPNTYALIGDKGRIALWTHSPPAPSTTEDDSDSGDDTQQDGGRNVRAINDMACHDPSVTTESTRPLHAPLVSLGMSKFSIIRKEGSAVSDPWRSCAWGAHPCQLIVASRSSVDLIDYRGATSQTCLFVPKTGESIRAIQEDHKLKLAPFQTYIATSHQIACIDQRFAKRPVISWAHQMDRAMPCGIKAMDLISEGENYTTVLTWNRRDADIVAYNVSLGSNEHGPEPISLMGQGQELPSFHSHTQYTNSNSLRDPQKRWQYRGGPDHILQQAVKPPLSGLAILPDFDINSGSDDEGEVDNARKWPNVSKFSLLQYASTGAVYAQEIELRTQMEVQAAGSEVPKDSILSVNHNKGSVPDTNAGSTLSSKIAHDLIVNEGFEEDDVIDRLFEAAEDNVVQWKRGVAEGQDRADGTALSIRDVRSHLDLNVQKLLNKLQKYMLFDRETRTKKIALNIDVKVVEAMKAIDNSISSISMYDILNTINCSGLSTGERNSIARLIQQNLELEPFVTTDGGEIIHRTVKRIWLVTDRKIDALILDKEPTEEAIVAFLEHQYPLPKSTVLEPNQIQQNESSITTRLASLSIPTSQAPIEIMDHTVNDKPQQQEEVWPTQESRLIRSRVIRRLAQELLLSSTVVIKTVEPNIPAAQTANEEAVENLTFQHLFQNRANGSRHGLGPPKILPRRCRPILGEWKVGEDPTNYVYRRPNNQTGDMTGYSGDGDGDSDGGDGETDQEEIQERNERLMQLRRKREERENKIKTIRKKDTGYNASAGGSASQPAGIVTDIQDFYSSMGEADEEGMFSLPTVISASQPASALRTGFSSSLSRSQQQQQQAKPKPIIGLKKTTVPASLPSLRAASMNDGESRFRKQSPILSQDQNMFSSATFVNSQEWETSLPAENPMKAVSMSQHSVFKSTQSQSQSQILSMSQDTDMMWGASQPVRGAFANRKIVGSGGAANKPKKKKNRTQGF